MAKRQYRYFTVDVSKELPDVNREELEILGEEIIDFVVDRTLRGRNKNNRVFPRYDEEYAEREGKDNPPDLSESGEMLEDIEVLQVKPRLKQIIIGYPSDYTDLGKVEGNVRGTYGQAKPIAGKARDFLGITAKDLKNITAAWQ